MPHLSNPLALLFFSIVSLTAAPRTWTSISGSKIEATYLGSFGDDLWFEGAGPQRRLLKMPAKYISEADMTLIESKEIAPQISAKSIDEDDTSIALLEQLLNTRTPEPIEGSVTLEEALNRLVGNIPQTDETKIAIKLHRKIDEDATRTDPTIESTVYACLQSLAEAHKLKWSIRKGVLNLRPR